MIGAMKSGAPGGAAKCFRYAARPCSLDVIVDRDGQRAAERHVDVRGRRHQPRNQAHQVARQDEDEHGPDDAEVARPLVADVVVQHRLAGGDRVLDQDLQLPGVVHREAAPRDQADHRPEDDDQAGHHEVVGDQVAVRGHGASERSQPGGDHRAERSIHRLDDPEFVL